MWPICLSPCCLARTGVVCAHQAVVDAAVAAAKSHGISSKDVVFLTAPLHTSFGFTSGALAATVTGAKVRCYAYPGVLLVACRVWLCACVPSCWQWRCISAAAYLRLCLGWPLSLMYPLTLTCVGCDPVCPSAGDSVQGVQARGGGCCHHLAAPHDTAHDRDTSRCHPRPVPGRCQAEDGVGVSVNVNVSVRV